MDSRGVRVIQNAYFSFQTHTKQLLLEIFCDTTAGIAARFQTQERTNRKNDRWTDRHGSRNSYLDAYGKTQSTLKY